MSQALPTMKTLGNRVLRECSVPVVSSFNPGNVQSTVAYDAILDGYADIWFANRWEWQRYEASIALAANTDEYPLPQNFHRMAIAPWLGPIRRVGQLKEVTPEEFYDMLAPMDPTSTGTPSHYTIDHTTLKLWPPPASAVVTQIPVLTFQYWLDLPARKTVAQEAHPLNYAPHTFEELLVAYGKWKLKQFLEFPDWEAEARLYDQKLRLMIGRDRQVRTKPTHRMAFNGISEW